tara:strand:+ start:199 stop:453 length:255 start_codon:yes stop_codon:yes gene_type:complete
MIVLDDFDTQIQCEDYWYDDYDGIPTDDIIDDDDEDVLDDTDEHDAVWDDDDEDGFVSTLIDGNGITAEGYNYLHELDTNGYFV